MDIESEFSKRKILKTNQAVYDLSLCRWKALSSASSKKKEITNPPCQGYIHAASKLNDSLYVIIGPDEKHPEQGMYSYNFKRNEWRQWPDCNLPANRDSFGFVSHQKELYMFGGSSFDSQLGDTHVFSNFTSSWRILDGYGPCPRNPMIFTDVQGQYILLYGGVDIEAQKIFEDAYLLIDGTWKQLQVKNAPRCLVGASSAVCGDEVFIFGGELQGYGGAAPELNTTLYKLAIDVDELGIEFIQVLLSNEAKPSPRTSHSMLGIQTSNIILIGGVALQGTNKNQILRDMWIFNLDLQAWACVDPANGALRGFCQSWLCLHHNKIFILGGLVERLDTWNEQISVIEFAEDSTVRNQICSNCQQRNQIRDRQQKAFPKAVLLSTGFFYNVSSEYRHPFQAILGLHQCSAALGATSFRFSIAKGLNESEVIEAEWDGNSLSRSQFQQLICHSSSPDENFSRIVSILKIASFRLGKTLLFIDANSKQRKVFLISSDSKVCPQFDETYSFFAYIQNAEKGMVQSHEGRNQKKIILNMLHSKILNPGYILARKNGTHLIIFQKNILVTSEKTYYYQLINSARDDITVYKSGKKMIFLQELGYHITREPQISLKNYISVASTSVLSPAFFINDSKKPVEMYDYPEKLKVLEAEGKIIQVQLIKSTQDLEYDGVVYQTDQSDVIDDNLGILVYYRDKLVNRLDFNFGDLFKEAFYKTKFKTATTIFPFLGIINVRKGIDLNYLGTWFKKKKGYFTFIENIIESMRRAKTSKMERQLQIGSEEAQQRKQTKPSKQ